MPSKEDGLGAKWSDKLTGRLSARGRIPFKGGALTPT